MFNVQVTGAAGPPYLNKEIRGARIFFGNRVVRPGIPIDTVIAEAAICGAFIGADGHPHRFPEEAATLMFGPPKTQA